MQKIIYFTFNDPPNGVYKSQVIEVVDYLNTLDQSTTVRLLVFLSPRGYFKHRKQIKSLNKKAVVIPAIAPLKYWYLNKLLLWFVSLFLPTDKVICRGPLATCMAIDAFKNPKIVYDGRGAVAAEHEEYGVFDHTGLEKQLVDIEKKAVIESDYRIAVTEKLVDYWKEQFNYSSESHVIIPCTVSNEKGKSELPQSITSFIKKNKNKVVYTFAGGNGKWQGIDLMIKFLNQQFEQYPKSVALLLCPLNEELKAFREVFVDRVLITTLKPEQVHSAISLCDYGLLLRHQTVTNKVASPVKVAEYLQAGLKVIISPEIGDYTELIQKEDCGVIYFGEKMAISHKVDDKERTHNQNVAQNRFSKNSLAIEEAFKTLITR